VLYSLAVQFDSAQLFISIAGSALPALVVFSYGYGRLSTKLDTVTERLGKMADALETQRKALGRIDRRLIVVETRTRVPVILPEPEPED
jgi:hypothetical protein